MILPAVLLALAALVPSDDNPTPKEPDDRARLQGVWVGKAGRDAEGVDVTVEFHGSSVAMTSTRDGQSRTARGDFKLDPAARPRALDLVDFRAPEDTPPRAAPPFIYAIDGDTLKLCGAGEPDQPRPTEFRSSGTGPTRTVLLELTRRPAPK